MEMDGVLLPGDAFRVIDRETLAGWNAYAHEQGRTSFQPEGIEVIDPNQPITAYAAYVLGEAPDGTTFGLDGVPETMWLFVVASVMEPAQGQRGRTVEVRASAFRAQPLTEPPPDIMQALYEGGERYRQKREDMGVPLGESLHGLTDS